ncbi:MAG: hypothetical protein PF450_07265 [Bacteroidales bacterium]|jgi:tetratricopeptide (TPR) repeat protein|nr:hypothetical protein [Bacteroidales bacterium]
MKEESKHSSLFIYIILLLVLIGLLTAIVSVSLLQKSNQQESTYAAKLFTEGDFEKLITHINNLPEDKQLTLENLYMKGFASYEEGRKNNLQSDLQNAAESLELALILYPDRADKIPNLYYILGKSYRYMEEYAKAKKMLTQAADFSEIPADIYYHLGYLSKQLGEFQDMEKYLMKVSEKNLNSIFFMVDAYESNSLPGKGAQLISKVISSFNAEYDRYILLLKQAELFTIMKEYQKAIDALNQILSFSSSDTLRSDVCLQLGDIHKIRGELVEARVFWRRAFEFNPGNSEAQKRLN